MFRALLPNLDPGRAKLRRIGFDRGDRRSVQIDEQAVARAARQGLETERAAAGEQIRDLQSLEGADPAGEHREQPFARPVAGRPCLQAYRGNDWAAPPATGD